MNWWNTFILITGLMVGMITAGQTHGDINYDNLEETEIVPGHKDDYDNEYDTDDVTEYTIDDENEIGYNKDNDVMDYGSNTNSNTNINTNINDNRNNNRNSNRNDRNRNRNDRNTDSNGRDTDRYDRNNNNNVINDYEIDNSNDDMTTDYGSDTNSNTNSNTNINTNINNNRNNNRNTNRNDRNTNRNDRNNNNNGNNDYEIDNSNDDMTTDYGSDTNSNTNSNTNINTNINNNINNNRNTNRNDRNTNRNDRNNNNNGINEDEIYNNDDDDMTMDYGSDTNSNTNSNTNINTNINDNRNNNRNRNRNTNRNDRNRNDRNNNRNSRNDRNNGDMNNNMNNQGETDFDDDQLYNMNQAGVSNSQLQRAQDRGPESRRDCKNLRCSRILKPVCACTNCGVCKTFVNDCQRRRYNCAHPLCPYLWVKNGKCIPDPDPCEKCSDVNSPVCGRNSKGTSRTFRNACQLRRYNCQNPDKPAFKFISNGVCPLPCKTCSMTYSPVCGKNKNGHCQTFRNLCMLERYNCLHKNENGFSPYKLVARRTCGRNCGEDEIDPGSVDKCKKNPIICACGNCNNHKKQPLCACRVQQTARVECKTFNNECELSRFNCMNSKKSKYHCLAPCACQNMCQHRNGRGENISRQEEQVYEEEFPAQTETDTDPDDQVVDPYISSKFHRAEIHRTEKLNEPVSPININLGSDSKIAQNTKRALEEIVRSTFFGHGDKIKLHMRSSDRSRRGIKKQSIGFK